MFRRGRHLRFLVDISRTDEWRALEDHAERMRSVHLRDLFAADPDRAERMTTTIGDLTVDWSKNLVSDETIGLLLTNSAYLEAMYPKGVMELGFDFVLDQEGRPGIIELNTQPGMAKPGLPSDGAFGDIFRRRPKEQQLYARWLAPHGCALAGFLWQRLQETEAVSLRRSA